MKNKMEVKIEDGWTVFDIMPVGPNSCRGTSVFKRMLEEYPKSVCITQNDDEHYAKIKGNHKPTLLLMLCMLGDCYADNKKLKIMVEGDDEDALNFANRIYDKLKETDPNV